MHDFHHLQHLFARKRFSSSLCRKNLEFNLQISSDQLSREVKSAQYCIVEYKIDLEKKGSYMCKYKNKCKQEHFERLLYFEQIISQDSLFRDDLFDKICEKIRNRNETMIIRNIGSLIVSFVQTLVTYDVTHLNYLYKCVNEDQNSAISFHDIRSQLDYFVGFDRFAFMEKQLEKLKFFVGKIGFKTLIYFMTTMRMYFLFLICEIKCDATTLNVVDRQNAHSMIVVVRALVELFRLMKREKELNREILAFSISHDHIFVRIYDHYFVIEENKTIFYRYPIHKFDFTTLDGKKK